MTTAIQRNPQRVIWDLVLTIVLLVADLVALVVSGILDFFAFAFTDYCPAPCHAGDGITVVLITMLCLGAVFVAGGAWCIVRLVRRRRAWWIALGMLVVQIGGGIAAFWIYAGFVNY